jgi:hypothetical protein
VIGTTLNHYRILEKIGSGGMGEVYLAEDAKLNRKVALKLLPAEFAASPDRLGRFEREAQAIAALNHPNIVTIHSIEQSDAGDSEAGAGKPLHFLTMELVTGRPLSAVILKGGLDLSRLLELGLAMRRTAQDSRFRPRQTEGGVTAAGDDRLRAANPGGQDRRRPHPRHRRLHGAGAGGRKTGRSAQRRFFDGGAAVRDGDRGASL